MSKKSFGSGVELKPGDVVVSVIFVNEANELDRRDFLKRSLKKILLRASLSANGSASLAKIPKRTSVRRGAWR